MIPRFLTGIVILLFANLISAQTPYIQTTTATTGFIENKGQIIDQDNQLNPAVLYLLNTPGFNVQLREGGFSYDVYRISNIDQRMSNVETDHHGATAQWRQSPENERQSKRIEYHRIDFDLLNSNPNCEIITSDPSSDYLNYYTTGTPVEGVTFVRSFQAVTYKNIYPGIDLEFLADEELGFKYNFVIKPGSNLSSIKIRIRGPEDIVETAGELHFITSVGDIDELIPHCYYRLGNAHFPVTGKFRKIGEDLVDFDIVDTIPEGATLFIDPVPTRRWGTYYGGAGGDYIYNNGCTVDNDGNIIIGGSTSSSTNIVTAGAFQTIYTGPGNNGYVAKFSTNGQIQWGTYFSGNLGAAVYAIAIDPSGNIFLAGGTWSTANLATPGAFQTVLRGTEDAFVVKFNPVGQRLWATYYGGYEVYPPGMEVFWACATDTSGNIYCAGNTTSLDYIATPGAVQPNFGGFRDAFLVKFTGDGQREWGTYYGGSAIEQDIGCTVSKNGFVYLSGATTSPNNIATPGSFLQTFSGSVKGFLACFNLDGQRLWGTYFGGESNDGSYGCAADTGSNVYLYGITGSATNIATPGVFQPLKNGGINAYLEKFSSAGARLWGTYYGVENTEIKGAAVDDSGFVFITGRTQSQNPVIASPGGYQTIFRGGSSDAFLAKLSGSGQRVWGTYYGGTAQDRGYACAVDQSDHIFLAGRTDSENQLNNDTSLCSRDPLANHIATPGSHQPNYGGSYDAFLVKFADCYSPDTALEITGPSALCQNSSGNIYSIAPIPGATDYTWCISGGLTITSGQYTTSITVSVGPALGYDTISVYGINSCDNGFPKRKLVQVNPRPQPVISGTDTTCTGAQNLFSTEGGNTNYQWTVSSGGNIVSGGATTDSVCTVVWNTAGAHWVKINYTDTNGCDALLPTQADVWVIAGPPVSITISGSANPVCSGTVVTFNAIAVNGGNDPVFQWKVNGTNAGTNSLTFSYTPADGDQIWCILTSSLNCSLNNPAHSDTIIMVVYPYLSVGVSVSPSANPVCEGIPVTFTAAVVNGGYTPVYQWLINGVPVGTNDSIFTYTPANGDSVRCILTSSEQCTSGNPASSDPVIITVYPLLPVSISISPSVNPACSGIPVTFTATPTNGGSLPGYQWQVNAINAGMNHAVFTYIPDKGDVVSCTLISSEPCTTGNPASSNPVIITVVEAPIVNFTPCFDTITTLNAKPFKLKGGIPLGGVYSGPGVDQIIGYFNPAMAGVGVHLITYTYTNFALCSDAGSLMLDVRSASPLSCGDNLLDIRDSAIYPTVQIGTQCWFAANLNYGTEIPHTTPQRDNCLPEKYTRPTSYVPRPTFYQWDELMQYHDVEEIQGLCPPGWRVPSENDWNILFANWTNSAFAGAPLKYSGYSGFNALLTGAQFFNKAWEYDAFATFFWSSTSHGPWKAWSHGMNDYDHSVSYYPSYRANAFSVRCIRD